MALCKNTDVSDWTIVTKQTRFTVYRPPACNIWILFPWIITLTSWHGGYIERRTRDIDKYSKQSILYESSPELYWYTNNTRAITKCTHDIIMKYNYKKSGGARRPLLSLSPFWSRAVWPRDGIVRMDVVFMCFMQEYRLNWNPQSCRTVNWYPIGLLGVFLLYVSKRRRRLHIFLRQYARLAGSHALPCWFYASLVLRAHWNNIIHHIN